MYQLLLAIHIIALAMWLGSGMTYALWSNRGRGVANLDITAFVFRTMGRSSAAFTVSGAFLTVLSGIGLTLVGGLPWFDPATLWLFLMQVLGILAMVIAIAVLHPRGLRMAQLAEQGVRRGHQDPEFYALNRQQALLSSLTGVLIVAIIVIVYLLRPA